MVVFEGFFRQKNLPSSWFLFFKCEFINLKNELSEMYLERLIISFCREENYL